MSPRADPWFEPLRPACADAREQLNLGYQTEVVLFYLARWCQKQARALIPDLDEFDDQTRRESATGIATNLRGDATTVERLLAGDGTEWARLKGVLLSSARPRARAAANDQADEAMQRIAEVLLASTPPSRAVQRLDAGPSGPRNEYIFSSPLELWSRAVVVRRIIDEGRGGNSSGGGPQRTTALPREGAALRQALALLPSLLDAISRLANAQRAAVAWSLVRKDLDDEAIDRLEELKPELFSEVERGVVASDRDIAVRLGSTARRVAANRSKARRKLLRREPGWALLLDALLPHRSTRPPVPPQSPPGVQDDGGIE